MSNGTRMVLDVEALADAIALVTRYLDMSMNELAAELGISPSTLTRIGQGQKPDADALVTILAWLNAPASKFTRERQSDAPPAG